MSLGYGGRAPHPKKARDLAIAYVVRSIIAKRLGQYAMIPFDPSPRVLLLRTTFSAQETFFLLSLVQLRN